MGLHWIKKRFVKAWIVALSAFILGKASTTLGAGTFVEGEVTVLQTLASVGGNFGLSVAGDLLVSSRFTNNILRYDSVTGAFKNIFASGNGLANPNGIAYGPDGNLYAGLGDEPRVLRFHGQTGAFIDEFVGPATPGGLINCRGIAFGPDGNLYVASGSGDQVLKYHGGTGSFLGIAAQGNGMDGPVGLAFGPDGNLYVTGALSNRVYVFDSNAIFLRTLSCGPPFSNSVGVAVDSAGRVFVSQSVSNNVLAFDSANGSCQGVFASGGLNIPIYTTIAPDGNLLVGSFGNDSVVKFNITNGQSMGALIPSGSGGLDGTHSMAFMPDTVVPATSTWGLIVLSLLVLVAGTVLAQHRVIPNEQRLTWYASIRGRSIRVFSRDLFTKERCEKISSVFS